MVKIRLARFGGKKRPFYHLVVTDSENPRDGRFLEQVGYYDPAKPVGEARIRLDRVERWLAVGAQLTTRVRHILNDYRRAQTGAGA
jgi:small subunit ribosomal protein S16